MYILHTHKGQIKTHTQTFYAILI